MNTILQTFAAKHLLNGNKISDYFTNLGNIMNQDILSYLSVPEEYYTQVGTVLIFTMIAEVVYLSCVRYLVIRLSVSSAIKKAKKPGNTTAKIRDAIFQYKLDVAGESAICDYFMFLSVMFGCSVPAISVVVMFYYLIWFFAGKSLLNNRSAIPESVSAKLTSSRLRTLAWSLTCRLIFDIILLTDPSIFPSSSQYNLLSWDLSSLDTSVSRIGNMGLHLIFFIIWLLYVIVDYIVEIAISIRNKGQQRWAENQVKELEKFLEEDEAKQNYMMLRESMDSYTLTSYAMFSNEENTVLRAGFVTVVFFDTGSIQ